MTTTSLPRRRQMMTGARALSNARDYSGSVVADMDSTNDCLTTSWSLAPVSPFWLKTQPPIPVVRQTLIGYLQLDSSTLLSMSEGREAENVRQRQWRKERVGRGVL